VFPYSVYALRGFVAKVPAVEVAALPQPGVNEPEFSSSTIARRCGIRYHRPMTEKPPDEPTPGMIGLPPSARGLSGRPQDIADHASAVAQEWEDVGERYVRRRME
jgi:hypothetical protein